MNTTQQCHVRWMIRRDLPEVLDIENHSFDCPWSEECFIRCLRQRNCIGQVAEIDKRVVGFMIYELHKHSIHVINIAVHRDYRRGGIGATMIHRLVKKLTYERRWNITLEVRETNLAAQLFFRANGFRAVSVLREFFDNDDDAYLMRYTLE